MKITCVIGTLGGGGAERAMTYLAGGLAERGHEVTVLTLDDSVPDFYPLSDKVRRVRVNLPSFKKPSFWSGIPRLWRLTCAVRQTRPDVVISFMTVSVLAACWLLRIPYLYADHLDIRHLAYSFKWRVLRNFLLARAYRVVVLSERDRKFIAMYHPRWTPAVIYNPALPAPEQGLPRPEFLEAGKKYVLAVGRLVQQKGFDLLLEAWRRVCDDFPDWRLCIIGAGADEAELKGLAETLDVQYSVQFVPPVQELQAVYQHVQLYAMSSRAEGFPMVLVEAMASGLPVVSFSCNGPDVIVRDGIDGYLVKPLYTDRLAAKMAELMKDDEKRRQFGEKAREVTSRFSLDKYLDAYEALCKEAVQ